MNTNLPRTRGGRFRLRLVHLLIATTVLAVALAWIGAWLRREWARRRAEDQIYQQQLTRASQRPQIEAAAASLGGSVDWYLHMPPPGLAKRRGPAAVDAFATRAIVQLRYYPPGRPPPSALQWETHLPTLLAYPDLETLRLREPEIDAATFKALPGSESLESIDLFEGTFPLEGFEWCGRCPNLRYFNYGAGWKWQHRGVPDAACLQALSQCELLETLYLDMLDIPDQDVTPITKLERLHTLHLSTKQPLDVAAVESLAAMPLKRLSLTGTPITKEHADALSKAKTLEILVLSGIDESTTKYLADQLPETSVRKRGPFGFPSERSGYSKPGSKGE